MLITYAHMSLGWPCDDVLSVSQRERLAGVASRDAKASGLSLREHPKNGIDISVDADNIAGTNTDGASVRPQQSTRGLKGRTQTLRRSFKDGPIVARRSRNDTPTIANLLAFVVEGVRDIGQDIELSPILEGHGNVVFS